MGKPVTPCTHAQFAAPALGACLAFWFALGSPLPSAPRATTGSALKAHATSKPHPQMTAVLTNWNGIPLRDNFSEARPLGKYEIHCYTGPENGKTVTTCIAVPRSH